jgi:hypothetical protein
LVKGIYIPLSLSTNSRFSNKKRIAEPNTGCNQCEAGIQNYIKPLPGIKFDIMVIIE